MFICAVFCACIAAQTITPSSWVPSNLGTKISQNAVTATDAQIRTYIDAYQKGIDTLDQELDIVKRCLPALKENVFILYREYNQNHSRSQYESPDFSVTECLDWLQQDMGFYLTRLAQGINPDLAMKGAWRPKTYWLPEWEIMGRYDAIVPTAYNAQLSWPLILSTQGNPDIAQIKNTPYILACCMKKGYQNNDTKEQAKNKAILLDMAYDFNIDPLRLFATGFSKGGQQSLKLGIRYPDWYAGIIAPHHDLLMANFPVQWEALMDLITIPTLIVHSPADGYFEDTTFHYMLLNGCPVQWVNDGNGHTADWIFEDHIDSLVAFCDTITMNPFPKKIRHTVEHKRYSRAYWTNMHAMADEGMIDARYEVEVIDTHLIEIRLLKNAAKVQGFDFYLSSDLIDMTAPLVVVCAGDTVYNAMPMFRTSISLQTGPTNIHANIVLLLWQQIDNIRRTTFGTNTQVEEAVLAASHTGPVLSAWPNPFNPAVTISLGVVGSIVQTHVYDISGRMVTDLTKRMVNGLVTWDASAQPSGVYVVRATVNGRVYTTQMTLMK